MHSEHQKRFVLAVTGASGSIYGLYLAAELLRHPFEVHLIVSDAGRAVAAHELGSGDLTELAGRTAGKSLHPAARLISHAPDDLFARPASGSFLHHGMAVCPCSMKTLASIAHGFSDSLVGRAADVTLKERRPLVLVTRESPLSAVHLDNMKAAHTAGATILPPVPAFYNKPCAITDIVNHTVARILDHLHVPQNLIPEWGA